MSILVVGGLEPFGIAFVNALYESYSKNVKIAIYGMPNPKTNINYFSNSILNDKENFKIFYGENKNEELIKLIVDSLKIDTIFCVPRGLCDPDRQAGDVVNNSQYTLHSVTHLLNALRKTTLPPNLIQFSTLKVYGESIEEQALANNSGKINPPSSFAAGLIGVEALLHSYAMSYRLDIKIVRIPDTIIYNNMPPGHFLMQILNNDKSIYDSEEKINLLHIDSLIDAIRLVAQHHKGIAEIFDIAGINDTTINGYLKFFEKKVPLETSMNRIDIQKISSLGWKDEIKEFTEIKTSPDTLEFRQAIKFLIFGGQGWIGQQFVNILREKGIQFEISSSKLGTNDGQLVQSEIICVAPSHIISFLENDPSHDLFKNGIEELDINMRDNLFAPWFLANLCAKFGIHFTYVGTGRLFEYDADHKIDGLKYSENDKPNFIGNKYSVVNGFADRTLQFLKHTLNVRICYPLNDSDSESNLLKKAIGYKKVSDIPNSITYLPDCLPILLNMCIQQRTGTINLVNPMPIKFSRILEIYQEATGKKLEYFIENSHDSNSTDYALDSAQIESLYPTILSAEEAVFRASKNLN